LKLTGSWQGRRAASVGQAFYVKELRGQLIACKWPVKRGRPLHPTTLEQNKRFKQANVLAKHAPAAIQMAHREMVEGTSLLPRDLMISAIMGRGFRFNTSTERQRYPVAARRDISQNLDILGGEPGDVLARGIEFWERVRPTEVGQSFISGPPGQLPQWQGLTPGAGGYQQIEDVTLVSGLPIGTNHSTVIPAGVVEVEYTVIVPSISPGMRMRIRLNLDTGANYWRQNSGLKINGTFVRQTISGSNGWYPFHTGNPNPIGKQLVHMRLNSLPDNSRRLVTWRAYSSDQNTMSGGGTHIVSPAAALSSIEIAGDSGAGLPAGAQIIVRATVA